MAYFAPDKRKVLKIIFELTAEKPYSDFFEVENRIPQEWKLKGCGTQNIQNVLVDLYREGMIGTSPEHRQYFLEGREIKNRSFFLSQKGRGELSPWALKHWQIIVGFLVSIATIVTAVYTALEYYK